MTLNRIIYPLLVLLMIHTMACSAQNTDKSPQQFWTEFRQAVVSNDMKKLADFTHFPLEVRGVDDSQPPTFYKRAQFAAIFTKALQQAVVKMNGDQVITKKSKDMIIAAKDLNASDFMTKDSFRVDQYVFENNHGKWLLVRMYIEE